MDMYMRAGAYTYMLVYMCAHIYIFVCCRVPSHIARKQQRTCQQYMENISNINHAPALTKTTPPGAKRTK